VRGRGMTMCERVETGRVSVMSEGEGERGREGRPHMCERGDEGCVSGGGRRERWCVCNERGCMCV